MMFFSENEGNDVDTNNLLDQLNADGLVDGNADRNTDGNAGSN